MGTVDELVRHVEGCIADVAAGRAPMPQSYAVGGFCGKHTRMLLNRLCSGPVASYLEVGVLHGATLCAAIEGNSVRAVGIDNFCQPDFGAHPGVTLANIARYGQANLLISDAFLLDAAALGPVDLFFYDGEHSEHATARAMPWIAPALARAALIIVDDYSWPDVRNGARRGLAESGLRVCWEQELTAPTQSHAETWWNGLGLFVVTHDE